VADLLERLQLSLGPSYRIEREFGGGMSRVFLAEDVRLGRKVVVKVLPPELASGVNLDRFEREIRLAAGLQHPHIVPLLMAGSAGDVPYYLMPYIEGESLRARLAREGELPLPEMMRLLREVLDALQYAHAHGVVHRDIKPDNVLLSAQHAVITDFGVARALSEATGDGRLTSTGLALGTPAYMAPEQIAGEPNVDHRADIYATGSLAFEMLTGMPPFRGATAQAVLAAHMSQSPPSMTSMRRAIPPELDALVLRCLEKRPADRWQSAGELIAQLDAIAGTATGALRTSGAGAGAPAAVPPPAPRPAEDRHPRPLRVVGLFAAASAVVLAVVWGLVQGLGLPDWVFQAGIALLLAGLPIMVFTSLRERQRLAAGNTATPVGLERLFTWRRSIQGGVLAFAGLGVATALFMASRALGIGPGATLLSAGVLTSRDRIVIADFTNRTPDTTLGATVTQLLRIDLGQSPAISVMEPGQVSEVLARMQRDRATPVTDEVAREVATREGMKAYLSGDILPAGTGFVIAARLVSPTTGDALVSLRQPVDGPDELMAGVDKLSSRLREEVGESLRSVRADPPLEQVTTSSLRALQLYAEATRAADRSGFDEAIRLLEQAVAEDSGFAMAWRRLGIYATNPGMGPLLRPKGDSAMRRAYALRDRLTTRERLYVEAGVAMTIESDIERAIAAYGSLIEKYPDDATALNNLGVAYDRAGRGREGLAMYRRTIATGVAPSLTYTNAAGTAGMQGLVAVADTVLHQLERDYPGSFDIQEGFIRLFSDRQDFGAVDSLAQVMVRGSPEARVLGHQMLAMTAALGGRLGDAAREWRNAVRTNQSRGMLSAADAAIVTEVGDIALNADVTNDPARAVRRLEAAWAQNRTVTAPRRPFMRRHLDFAHLFALLGDTLRARQLMNEFSGIVTEREAPAIGMHTRAGQVLAAIPAAAGRPSEVLARLREGCGFVQDSFMICDSLAFVELAQAYDRAGQADSAIAVYRRFAELRAGRNIAPPGALDVVTIRIAPVWRRLGELYEGKGDRRNAIEAYEKFLDFWRNADPELQPTVRSVRERLDRLRRAVG
jgi:tetratricopeptide (TPR) repeat protein